jgi:hypothetical protein
VEFVWIVEPFVILSVPPLDSDTGPALPEPVEVVSIVEESTVIEEAVDAILTAPGTGVPGGGGGGWEDTDATFESIVEPVIEIGPGVVIVTYPDTPAFNEASLRMREPLMVIDPAVGCVSVIVTLPAGAIVGAHVEHEGGGSERLKIPEPLNALPPRFDGGRLSMVKYPLGPVSEMVTSPAAPLPKVAVWIWAPLCSSTPSAAIMMLPAGALVFETVSMTPPEIVVGVDDPEDGTTHEKPLTIRLPVRVMLIFPPRPVEFVWVDTKGAPGPPLTPCARTGGAVAGPMRYMLLAIISILPEFPVAEQGLGLQ